MKSEYSFLVSVRLMTYNHESFICKAMDSILMQKTDFPFEVVIGDDFSTDRTLNILKEYKDTSNVQINILNRKINDEYWKKRQEFGRIYNFVNILQNCKGKYIALLDGDDYWVDKNKLQEQVAFLESNPDFTMCFTNVCLVNKKDNIIVKSLLNYQVDTFTHETFVAKISPPTMTTVFRKDALPLNFPDDFNKVTNADMFLKAMLSREGKVKFIDKVTGNKCLHGAGIYAGTSAFQKIENKLRTQKAMLKYFQSEIVRSNLKSAISLGYVQLLYNYALNKKILCFLKTLFSVIIFSVSQRKIPPIRLMFSKYNKVKDNNRQLITLSNNGNLI